MNNSLRNISIPTVYNYFIFFLFSIAPFAAYFTQKYLDLDFNSFMILLCFISVFFIFIDKINFKFPAYFLILLLFVFYTIFSDIYIVGRDFNLKYIWSNHLIGTVLIFLIIENSTLSEKFFNVLFVTNTVILIIAFIVIIIQQFYDPYFFVDSYFYSRQDSLTFSELRLPSIYTWGGSLSSLGLCFVPILGLTIAHYFRNNYNGIIYFFVIGGIVSFLSRYRFIMLNFLLLFLLIPIYRKFQFKRVLLYTIITIVISMGAYYVSKTAGLEIDRLIQERIFEKNRGGVLAGTAGTRIFAFKVFNTLFYQSPIIGKGKFHSSGSDVRDTELINALHGRSSQIHVGYLSLFYYYGIIGGTIYLLFLLLLTRELFLGARKTSQWGPFFSLLLFITTNLTAVILDMFYLGIIISLLFHKYYMQNLPEESIETTSY
jgi:hypothetical protein